MRLIGTVDTPLGAILFQIWENEFEPTSLILVAIAAVILGAVKRS